MSFEKRPTEELYLVEKDPEYLKSRAEDPDLLDGKRQRRERMEKMLREEGDPRVLGNAAFFAGTKCTGPDGHSWENWLKTQHGKICASGRRMNHRGLR